MDVTKYLQMIKESKDNAIVVLDADVLYDPQQPEPVTVISTVRHMQSGIEYQQRMQLNIHVAQLLGEMLKIQAGVAGDYPPPSF